MLAAARFVDEMCRQGVTFATGVPDSTMQALCTELAERQGPPRHIVAANEGNAVAMAAGHWLATATVPLVYMQNSGLGNAVNPLASLTSRAVYGIPLVVLVGWRGEPGSKDEPQHGLQGRATGPLLDALAIEAAPLPTDPDEAHAALARAVETARSECLPVALVVRKGTFEARPRRAVADTSSTMTRAAVIEAVVGRLGGADVVVATTGKASRELFELREARGESHERDFLNVGAMGHASSVALAVAMARQQGRVVCLDGDGALLMHMGALAVIGSQGPRNLVHVVLNNGAHDSVGGQPTVGRTIDIPSIATACGYRTATRVATMDELQAGLDTALTGPGPSLLDVVVSLGGPDGLGRPTVSPQDAGAAFRAFLRTR